MATGSPPLHMTWPGAVPIFRACSACEGKGSSTLDLGTQTFVTEDGSIVGTILTGQIVICSRCSGWGNVTYYGTRGKSFTPVVRRNKGFGRLFNCLGLA